MSSLLRIARLGRRHAVWLAVAAAAMVVVAGATVFAYNLVRPIFDEVLGSAAPRVAGGDLVARLDAGAAALRGRLEGAGLGRWALPVLAVLAVATKGAGALVARYGVARAGLATLRDLRDRAFDALLAQDLGFFRDTPSGVLVARLTHDVQLLHEALSERLGDLVQDTLTVAVLVAYLVSLNARLAIATVVVAPLLVAPVVRIARGLRQRSRETQVQAGLLATAVDEAVRGITVVQACGAEEAAAGRFRGENERHFRAALRARALQALNAPLMEVVGVAAALALIAYAGAAIERGAMTLGGVSAFLVAAYGAYNPIKRLNKLNLALQQAAVAAERVLEVVDARPRLTDRPDAVELDDLGDGVELDRVGFTYPDGRVALDGVSLRIRRGETVALVGPSGAGKTTVAMLVLRFWDPQSGAVRVGGRDIRELTRSSLRRCAALVGQETTLFHDTVTANIAFGDPAPDSDRVEAAARAALAHDFIVDLPLGYETVLGSDGLTLSGGQRQRLAVARAIYRNPELLVLDEATSALDAESERVVGQALEALMSGRTTLVIAHRSATVRRADRVVVIERGRVVQVGRQDELAGVEGPYRRLLEAERSEPRAAASTGRDGQEVTR